MWYNTVMDRDSKGRFIKGIIPWIKGKKGVTKANSGSFKKGHINWNAGKHIGIIEEKLYFYFPDKSSCLKITLSQGKFSLIDEEDFERVNQYKWHLFKSSNKEYAATNMKINGKVKVIKLHRFLLNAPKGIEVDHKNGDGLDNRKINIRLCTDAENSHNRKISKNKSGYKGVFIRPNGKCFAYISVNNKRIHLGEFTNPKDAARTYNKAALKYHGEFANLNTIAGLVNR